MSVLSKSGDGGAGGAGDVEVRAVEIDGGGDDEHGVEVMVVGVRVVMVMEGPSLLFSQGHWWGAL